MTGPHWHFRLVLARAARIPQLPSHEADMRKIDHFVAGASYASGERQGEVFDPNNGGVQAHVGFGTSADLERAVAAAREALPAWAATNPQRRARVMFRFKELVEANMEDLALLLASEHGKVIADARGDVPR